jgi:hypothetical protein
MNPDQALQMLAGMASDFIAGLPPSTREILKVNAQEAIRVLTVVIHPEAAKPPTTNEPPKA